MEEKHIYFVRHGESESNVDGIYRGAAALLTENGRKQASTVARRMVHMNPTALFSSDFPRAFDTANAIANVTGLSIEQREMFGEWREPTLFFGKHKDDSEIHKIFTDINTTTTIDYRHSDEEIFTEFMERARGALTFLEEYNAQRICVVTHGGLLRMFLGNILFGDSFTKEHFIKSFETVSMHNTGITHFVSRTKNMWKLISWNDYKHLSQENPFNLERTQKLEQLG